MKTRTKILIFIALSAFSILVYFCNQNLSLRMRILGINLDVSGMALKDSYLEEVGTNKVRWFVGESPGVTLFLGRVAPEDVGKYINDKIFTLMSLYEPATSPYPEVITNIIDCPDEFKPISLTFGAGKVYKLFAGERFNYGICTNDLIKYDSLYGIFSCGKKGVILVKLFSNSGIERIQKIMESFKCK